MIWIIYVFLGRRYMGSQGAERNRGAMMNFPWKTLAAGAMVLGLSAYAIAQSGPGLPMSMSNVMHQHVVQGGIGGHMHEQMMQGSGIHGGSAMHGQQSGAIPTSSGQDAFGAIQEIVQILESDPATDWSKVNIDALREHLIDMNEVTLHAAARERTFDNGIEIAITGEGRTPDAIKRMVPAHVHELVALGWNAETEDLPNGVKLTVRTNEALSLTKLKALGFMGIMVQGGHHQPHHLMMAKGAFSH